MNDACSFTRLSDPQLLAEVKRLALHEREATAQLIRSLVELDSRKLFLGEGCPSLFTYCTHVLHLSEGAAYGRIQAARAGRRFPVILTLLEEGSLNLTTVGLLAPHLTEQNHREALEAARHRSKRDVEQQVATLHPRPDVSSSVRKLPAPPPLDAAPSSPDCEAPTLPTPCTPIVPPARPAVVAPLAPERYQVRFTVSRETHDKLRRAQDLLRHAIPTGDPAAIFDRALNVLLADLARTKLAAARHPRPARRTRPHSRRIPAAVRRAVWARDGGQCAFVGTQGRCPATGFLEFHHVVPFAVGGTADIGAIELRCAAHNKYEAEQYFGPSHPWLVRERGFSYGVPTVTTLTSVLERGAAVSRPSRCPAAVAENL